MLLFKKIANFTVNLLQNYKYLECEIFRIPLKHVSNQFISFFSICMTVPLNILQVVSASYSFNKTTSPYQIHIIHPTFHFPFPAVAADRQVNEYTDRQPARQTGRQAGRQEDRQEDSHTGQIHRYTCVMSVCREPSFCFLGAYQLSVDLFKIK